MRGLRGRDDGGNVNNVQYQNCHYRSPLYNEYFLIKIYLKKKQQKKHHFSPSEAPFSQEQQQPPGMKSYNKT
jgi:hypothetical protein